MDKAKLEELLARLESAKRRSKARLYLFLAIGLGVTTFLFGPYFYKIAVGVFGHNQSVITAAIMQEQAALWESNPTCGVGKPDWHPTNRGGEISVAICPRTGDVLLMWRTDTGKMWQSWVPPSAMPWNKEAKAIR